MKNKSAYHYSLFQNFHHFHSIILYYVDLSCFLITHGPPQDWWALNRRKRVANFHSLEVLYRSAEARDRFIQKCFDQLESTRKTVCGERLGFHDFFVPVIKDGKILGTLQAGAFRKSEITSSFLEESWRELTGKEPTSALPEYREFVRVLLEIPVLDGPLFPAFQESLELFSRLLAAREEMDSIGKRLNQLFREVFSKHLPHSYWLDWALGRPISESVPAWSRQLEKWSWTKDEIGLTRVPTTVLTVIPRRPVKTQLDWTEETVRVYQFQRRCFLFSQTLPETVGGKLEDYGAVFVTSADPELPRLAQRRWIETLAKKIHDFAVKELGVPVLIGIGETVLPGEPLNKSYRQAVLALHLKRGAERNIVFYAEKKKEKTTGGFDDFENLLEEINRSFSRSSFLGLEAVKEEFIKGAIRLSFSAPREIPLHFRYALNRLSETAAQRMNLSRRESDQLRREVIHRLEAAATFQDLVLGFQEALRILVQRIEKPKSLQETYSMDRVREYLNQNFKIPIRTGPLAKLAGVSVSTLSRRFHKTFGVGLENFLQNRRLDEARELLKTTSLPIAKIAADCGFRSASAFTRFFRKKSKISPQKFREKSQAV